MPYKGGRYVPPVRDEDDLMLRYPSSDRHSLAYLLRSGQAAMGMLMVGFIYLVIDPIGALFFAFLALLGGAYARSHGGRAGTAVMMLSILLMVISLVMWVAHVTLLPWD
jgi:hypothetical protein